MISPCSYQGGKQRLAQQIVDIFYKDNGIDDETKFFDLCCGSGAITLELINRGIHPGNITMVDVGCYGAFWNSVANCKFDLTEFRKEIDNLPPIDKIHDYLQELSNAPVDSEKMVYHYLLLQAGSFGSKQIWIENGKWKNNSFRSYWLPTKTSNRRSPVNPMMPMPETLFQRTKEIVDELSGRIRALNTYVENSYYIFDELQDNNAIAYIDPPYSNTTGYGFGLNVGEVVLSIWNNIPIYVSEGQKMYGAKSATLLSEGRSKGNISGYAAKKPCEEWLNQF